MTIPFRNFHMYHPQPFIHNSIMILLFVPPVYLLSYATLQFLHHHMHIEIGIIVQILFFYQLCRNIDRNIKKAMHVEINISHAIALQTKTDITKHLSTL